MSAIITLSFDDGWLDQYDNAFPILDRYGYKSTFYIITQYLDAPAPDRMNDGQVRELSLRGHEIGAHTVSHPNLQLFPLMVSQIKKSKRDLEKRGYPVKSFAYPFGRYNTFVRQKVIDAGFTTARAVVGAYNGKDVSPWDIVTQPVIRKTTVSKVREWIETAKQDQSWLVLLFHQVNNMPYQYGCTIDMFEKVCELIKETGLPVLPLTNAYEVFHKAS